MIISVFLSFLLQRKGYFSPFIQGQSRMYIPDTLTPIFYNKGLVSTCCMPGINADADRTKMNKMKILSTFMSLSTLSFPSAPLCTPILHSSFWSYSSTYLLTSRSLMKALPKRHLILWIAPLFLKSFFLLSSDTTQPLGFSLPSLLFQVHPTLLDH